MLEKREITFRLREMREQDNPAISWDEQCEGSARGSWCSLVPARDTTLETAKSGGRAAGKTINVAVT